MVSHHTNSRELPQTLLGRILHWVLTLAAALITALVLCVLVEWIGLTVFWSDEGSARSAAVLRQDIAWLTSHSAHPIRLWGASGSGFALSFSQHLYQVLFVWTGVEGLVTVGLTITTEVAEYLQAAMNAIQIFLVRVAIIVSALPLFIVFGWWGVVEGLVRRDLRRWGGDIERGTVYHLLKHLNGAIISLPVILYLAWPDSIHPGWVFGPFALAFGLLMMAMVTTFTKYV